MENKDVQKIEKMTIQYAKEIIKPGMSLIDLRNDLISRGKYTDVIDELIIKFTKAKVKKIKIKVV